MSTINYETGLPYLAPSILAAYSHTAEPGPMTTDTSKRAVNLAIRHLKTSRGVAITIDCPDGQEYEDCVERFKELNPDYSVFIWSPHNVDERREYGSLAESGAYEDDSEEVE